MGRELWPEASLEIGRIGNSLVQNVSMRVVNYAAFNNFIALVILLNVILLGIEVDITATTPLDEVPSGFWVANAVIVGIFVVELLLKMSAFGCHSFWFGAERLWSLVGSARNHTRAWISLGLAAAEEPGVLVSC